MKPEVLCINRETLTQNNIPIEAFGIYPFNIHNVETGQCLFISRSVVDSTEALDHEIGCLHPQILAYCLVKHGDEVLTYSRAKGAETRLHGSLSLGFGGHVDQTDFNSSESVNIYSIISKAMYRELEEELGLIPNNFTINNYNQLIVDTTNPVGKVHVGLKVDIYIKDKNDLKIDPNEIHLPEWKTLTQLKQERDQYENWSKLIIDTL